VEQVCALVGGGGELACPGPFLPCAVGVAAAELSGGADGDAPPEAPGDADGPDMAVAANSAEMLNRSGAARLSLSD
jgi:hypothetical protein